MMCTRSLGKRCLEWRDRHCVQPYRLSMEQHSDISCADGTPLCDKMLWKVLLAKAAEDYADANKEFRDLLESHADSLLARVEVPGDIFRDALMVQVSLDPPDGPPPPTGARVLPAEIAILEEFLDDVGITQRKHAKFVVRFKGAHQVLRRDDPALKGVAVLIIL